MKTAEQKQTSAERKTWRNTLKCTTKIITKYREIKWLMLFGPLINTRHKNWNALTTQSKSTSNTGSLILYIFFPRDFASMQLENLRHFSNLRDNSRFSAIWHTRSLAALSCWRLAESEITIMPSVTGMDWLCWWYNHVADVLPPSTALAFVTPRVRNINLHIKCNPRGNLVKDKFDVSMTVHP